MKTHAEESNNLECCELAVNFIYTRTKNYKGYYEIMKKRFEAWFDELSLDKNIGLYVKKPWCVSTFLGCLCMVNQYCAYPRGDGGRITNIVPAEGFCGETGNGPFRSFLWCHSNSKQQNEAINKLKAEISSYKSRMRGIAFLSKVTTFYEGLDEEQTFTCNINGQVHDIVPACKQDPTKCF